MTLLDKAVSWFNGVKTAPVDRKVADMIANPAGIADDHFPSRVDGRPFVPGLSYFGVRLSGLHLVDARKYTETRLPLCVCLVEFEHDGQRRTVPFSIGPDDLRKKLSSAGIRKEDQSRPAWIELRDLTVVRPTPVNEANLSLYAGLFSVPQDNLVKTLLDVVGSVGTALAQPAVGASLKVAEKVYDSFGALLGLGQVEQVSAALIGNALTESGSGYLLIANVGPDVFDPRRGRVVGGRLHWPLELNDGAAVTQFDHALLALEQYDTIIQKETGLAPVLFQSMWGAVLKAPREQAKAALGRLQDAIAASPDITENDRIALIGSYGLTFERLAQVRWPATDKAGADRGGADRAARGGGAPDLALKLASAGADLPVDRSHARKTLEDIAEALAKQADQWDAAHNQAFAAAMKPGVQAAGGLDAGALDDAVFESADAVRQALLKAGHVPAASARGLSTIVARAAQI